MLLIGDDEENINKLKRELMEKYEMTNLRRAKSYLIGELEFTDQGVWLYQ